MILLLAACSALLAAFPTVTLLLPAETQTPAPPLLMVPATFALIVVVYGGLGHVGLRLGDRIGFAGIWDPKVGQAQRFGIPAAAGLGLSIFFVVGDVALAPLHGLGRFPHPPFPFSVGASLTAGIGEEVLFRLFFISFWVWLISGVLLKGRRRQGVFVGVTAASALLFTVAHFPAVMLLLGLGSVDAIPPLFAAEMLLLNGALAVLAAVFLQKWGILAAAGLHFWTDVGWHVVWGSLGGG
jgi:hypothetical protein